MLLFDPTLEIVFSLVNSCSVHKAGHQCIACHVSIWKVTHEQQSISFQFHFWQGRISATERTFLKGLDQQASNCEFRIPFWCQTNRKWHGCNTLCVKNISWNCVWGLRWWVHFSDSRCKGLIVCEWSTPQHHNTTQQQHKKPVVALLVLDVTRRWTIHSCHPTWKESTDFHEWGYQKSQKLSWSHASSRSAPSCVPVCTRDDLALWRHVPAGHINSNFHNHSMHWHPHDLPHLSLAVTEWKSQWCLNLVDLSTSSMGWWWKWFLWSPGRVKGRCWQSMCFWSYWHHCSLWVFALLDWKSCSKPMNVSILNLSFQMQNQLLNHIQWQLKCTSHLCFNKATMGLMSLKQTSLELSMSSIFWRIIQIHLELFSRQLLWKWTQNNQFVLFLTVLPVRHQLGNFCAY